MSLGVLAHTKGLGADFQMLKHWTATTYGLIDLSFHSLKHPKEIRLPNPDINRSRPFVFGKQNAFYTLKTGFGLRYIIAGKENDKSVKVNLNFVAGPSLGILKPVYYDVRIPVDGKEINMQVKFDPDNETHQYYTHGNAPFTKGLKEVKFMPGANARSGLSFEWGQEANRYYSIETGLIMDAFPKEVPIFAITENQRLFINLFLTFSYGIRR